MPLTSQNCCWRRLLKTACTTGEGIFRVRLSVCRSVVASSDMRRSTISITRLGGIPNPSKSRGTGVTKSESSPVSSDIASWESIGRNQGKGYARPAARNRHNIVWMVALVVWLLWLALAPAGLRAADDPARLYAEGRKAERAGHMAQAYLLYSQAAALEPQNQLYQLRSQAVQSRAALESPPK